MHQETEGRLSNGAGQKQQKQQPPPAKGCAPELARSVQRWTNPRSSGLALQEQGQGSSQGLSKPHLLGEGQPAADGQGVCRAPECALLCLEQPDLQACRLLRPAQAICFP